MPAQRLGRRGRPVPARPRRAGPDRRGRGRARRRAAPGSLTRCGAPGWQPVTLGAKDGLAICSSSAVSVGTAALALLDCEACLAAAQVSAALSMEGFRANLSPLDPRVVAARPAPGQEWAAAGLRALLADGALTRAGRGPPAAGPAQLSLRQPDPRLAAQRARSPRCGRWRRSSTAPPTTRWCSPTRIEILSTGNFHVPALALALDATAIAVAQVAATLGERPARLRTERLSGLPANLVDAGVTQSGMAPLLKTAQALTLEIRHLAAPLAISRDGRRRRRRGRLDRRDPGGPAPPRAAGAAAAAGRARAGGRRAGGRSGGAGALGARHRGGSAVRARARRAAVRGPAARTGGRAARARGAGQRRRCWPACGKRWLDGDRDLLSERRRRRRAGAHRRRDPRLRSAACLPPRGAARP